MPPNYSILQYRESCWPSSCFALLNPSLENKSGYPCLKACRNMGSHFILQHAQLYSAKIYVPIKRYIIYLAGKQESG